MDKMSIIRTIILLVALANQGLVASGHQALPIDDETVNTAVSTAWTVIASLWAWWKNNYLSNRGQMQKEVLKSRNLYKP